MQNKKRLRAQVVFQFTILYSQYIHSFILSINSSMCVCVLYTLAYILLWRIIIIMMMIVMPKKKLVCPPHHHQGLVCPHNLCVCLWCDIILFGCCYAGVVNKPKKIPHHHQCSFTIIFYNILCNFQPPLALNAYIDIDMMMIIVSLLLLWLYCYFFLVKMSCDDDDDRTITATTTSTMNEWSSTFI